MAQAEIDKLLAVDFDRLFDVITDYAKYPEFVEGCTQVKIVSEAAGKKRVTYHVSMMKDVVYTLDHQEDRAAGRVEWMLVESDTFKKNSGRWELKNLGPGKTQARYSLDVDFKIPVPSFVLGRLVKGSLPSMIESFEKRTKSVAGKK